MDLVAVHAPLAAGDDLGLDAFRFAPLPPLRPAALRQQVSLLAAPQIAVVILPERLRAGPVMAVEIPDPAERFRPAGLHRLIFRDQKSPFLQIIPLNRPVVAVVAHRILRQGDSISELVNMHSNDGVGFWFTCQTARGCVSAFSRHVLPEACGSFRPLEKKRAQGKPGARCTRGLVCKLCKEMRTRAYRSSGGIPAFPARWLDGLLRALPGERAFLPPSPAEAWLLANLAPASRRQDHTTSPYASAALVSHSSRVHRIPPRVRDDRDPPLSSGETGRVRRPIRRQV